jgi:hypothetical protein
VSFLELNRQQPKQFPSRCVQTGKLLWPEDPDADTGEERVLELEKDILEPILNHHNIHYQEGLKRTDTVTTQDPATGTDVTSDVQVDLPGFEWESKSIKTGYSKFQNKRNDSKFKLINYKYTSKFKWAHSDMIYKVFP